MDKDSQRAMWVAELAIAYLGKMTDGERLQLLGHFFDLAFTQGQNAELKSDIAELKIPTVRP